MLKELFTSTKLWVICIICILCIYPVSGQNSANKSDVSFSGKIVDAENGQPMELATVVLPGQNIWAVSDVDGRFKFTGLKPGEYRYEVKVLGFQKYEGKVVVGKDNKPLTIKLQPMNLALDEVVVTAEAQKMGSSSRIDQTAVQHIQPKSLQDMLQLVPGNVTQNPNLNGIGQAYIREIGNDNANNASGTLVVVDGAPLSNDANMQTMSTSKGGTATSQSTAGKGVDLRSISPDNIESVEVIRGIPSVEYGNLTSGAMIVKTRSGATPWEAKFKVDPYSKIFYFGKGFFISDKLGSINVSADYSQSYDDIRMKYNGFDRITASLGYSNIFMKNTTPLTFNLRIAYYSNINSQKSDPDMRKDEYMKNKNNGIRFSLEGNWALRKSWISSLGYSFMANYSSQKDERKDHVILQSGVTPVGNALVSSEYKAFFLNQSYYSEYLIEGKPLDLFFQVKANKLFQFTSDFYMNLKLGAEWRYNRNFGDGLIFNPLYPPQVINNQTVRPRPYNIIPAMNVFSVFLEDKLQVPIMTTNLTVQAGIRMSDIFIDKMANRDDMLTVEPRVNVDYNILNRRNNNVFDDFSVVGGYGVAAKAPTLLQLYPDKAYFDVTSYSIMFQDDPIVANGQSMAVMTTKVIDDTSNPRLKPSYSYKGEIGLSMRIKKISGMVTFFNEQHKNEYSYNSRPVIMPVRRYSTPNGIDGVKYENGMVQYQQNGIWNNASVKEDMLFYNYLTPSNGVETTKRGIEYTFNLGQIPAIKTSLVVDGAWLYIKRKSTLESYSPVDASYEGGLYPWMPIYPGGSGTVSNRFNTNFRFITHIPQIRMIFSTTLQVIWAETYRNIYEDSDGNNLFYRMADPFSPNGKEAYFVNPVGFLDTQGTYTAWQPGFEKDSRYRYMLKSFEHNNYFGTEKFPITAILNFRLTKEFGKIMELSFMANNFLKIYKTHKKTTAVGWRDLTIPLYFGAEIKIKI